MPRINPAEVQRYLEGIRYPASKDELISHAVESGAPQEVIEELDAITDGEYTTPAEVMQEFGELETV